MKLHESLPLIVALILPYHALSAESATELIQKGDAYSQKLQETEALKSYLAAEKLDPNNVALQVSIAKQYRHSMHNVSSDEEREQLGRTALRHSQRAVDLAPNSAEAQLSLAISYGKVIPFEGNKEKAHDSLRLKAAAEKCLNLDPDNDMAWHVLGRWHKSIAGLNVVMKTLAQVAYGSIPHATNEDAVKCFERAIKINPHRLMHYIELGMTYAQMGQKTEARQYLQKGLAMRSEDKDDPELKFHGREVLTTLE